MKGIRDLMQNMIAAMLRAALDECDRIGVSEETFYLTMFAVQDAHPELGVAGLLDRTLDRVYASLN